MLEVSMYILHVCVSEGFRENLVHISGFFLKNSISEIPVKRICKGVGVCKKVDLKKHCRMLEGFFQPI